MCFFDSSFVPHALGRVRILCAYIFISVHFNSIHFYSILFYSAWRKKRNVTNDNERKRKKRKITKITKKTKITKYYENYENYENYEILRKKGKMLLKHHDSVIFYIVSVYFFIHLNNETIAFFLFFVRFPFFSSVSLFSFLFVICELRFYLVKKIVIVRKRSFSISTKN